MPRFCGPPCFAPQIFTTRHPPRLVCPPARDPETLLPPVAAAAAEAQADDLGPLLGDAGDGGSGGTGYGGSGDGGTRDLTLTLLSTIMVAAEAAAADADSASTAPEPPPAAVTAAQPAADGATGHSPVPAPPAASNVAVAAAAATAAHSVSAAAAAAMGAAGGAVAGAASLLSGFLKFGRYSQPGASVPGPQLHPQPQLSVPTAPGSSGTAADGALGGLGGAASAHLHFSGTASEPLLGAASVASSAASAAAGTQAAGASRDPSVHGNQAAAAAVASGAVSRWASFGAGRWRRDWGWGARCTRPFATVATATPSRGSLAAVAAGRNGYLYCVGQGGVRVLAEPQTLGGNGGGGGATGLTVVRSAQLDGELLSLALLSAASTPGELVSSAGSNTDDSSEFLARRPAVRHPLMLAGSHNRKVYAYAPDVGRVVGCWEAHDDAVCCVALAGTAPEGLGAGAAAATGCTLVTSSWDCSVKVWRWVSATRAWVPKDATARGCG